MAPNPEVQELDSSEIAAAVATALGIPRDGNVGSLIAEQVMAQVKEKVDELGLVAEIAALKEQLAAGPPGAKPTQLMQLPPWAHGSPGVQAAAALGLPDPNWHNPEAEGAKLDGKFDSFGDYLRAVIKRDMKGVVDDRLVNVSMKGDIRAELTGEEIELGGALVPEEFRPMLLMQSLQPSSIRMRAMVLPMASSTLTLPAIRDKSHADNVFGGVAFEWLETNDAISESEPEFQLIRLTARTLAGKTVLPNVLLEDSFLSVPTLIMALWGQAVPWIEESNFVRGDGVGKPLGFLNSPALVSVTRATTSEIKIADIANMEAALPPGSDGRAVWMVNPQAMPQIYQLNQGEVQVWHPAISEAMPSTLNGRPIVRNEHMGGLGALGDICLVDWMYYLIGDRQALSMAASQHEQFSSNQTVLRGIERIAGTPWLDTPLIPAQRSGNTFQLSPFIALAA